MNTSTKQIKNNKNFDKELQQIDFFNPESDFKINIVGHDDIKAKLTKKDRKFDIKINARVDDSSENDDFSFIVNKITYETKKLGNTSSNSAFKINESANFSTSIEVNTFHAQNFSRQGRFKAFYPVDLSEIKTFHTEFETITYQRNRSEHFYDCLRINLNGIDYDVTQLKNELSGYYVFECLSEQLFDEFSEACFSFRQAIGFINKLMVGSEEYVFDDSCNLYYSNYIRPTIKGMYHPITTNPYSYLDIESEIADQFYGKLTRITLENLSTLTNRIHNDSEFSCAILVILEATSIRSLLLIPSSFAVIIEMLSKNLSIDEVGSEVPIANNNIKKKIIEELHEVIDKNSAAMSNESILKLKRRLNEINKPTNRQHLTNNEKLTKPFEQLGISLSIHGITIIEHRNDLLHGNILLRNENNLNDDDTDTYMSYVSAKLFTLISKLILKSIGYEGYIYNQAKYLEKHLRIETSEEYFERI